MRGFKYYSPGVFISTIKFNFTDLEQKKFKETQTFMILIFKSKELGFCLIPLSLDLRYLKI